MTNTEFLQKEEKKESQREPDPSRSNQSYPRGACMRSFSPKYKRKVVLLHSRRGRKKRRVEGMGGRLKENVERKEGGT